MHLMTNAKVHPNPGRRPRARITQAFPGWDQHQTYVPVITLSDVDDREERAQSRLKEVVTWPAGQWRRRARAGSEPAKVAQALGIEASAVTRFPDRMVAAGYGTILDHALCQLVAAAGEDYGLVPLQRQRLRIVA